MSPPDARSIVFGVVAACIAHRAGWSTVPLVAAVWWLHGEVTGDGSGEPLPEIDDSAYRPAVVDPLLRGAARVTGMTAKAVRRGKALTRSEYARQENQR